MDTDIQQLIDATTIIKVCDNRNDSVIFGDLYSVSRFMEEQGYTLDITDQRMHHEIYLSDARRVAPEKLKTVVRHPIKTMGE
ncbi:MAG: hypothetical protein BWX53_00068 [Parcubacteria group bacterium ADurb.Bin016]|nr:MAG: hypothetical protein BWX53_00068 [Parcubacteria group bacterium ADurb.Bin016]